MRTGQPLVMSFTSTKGGVGKTTTAANVAAYIAKAAEISDAADRCRVLLVDGDLANGNLAQRVAQASTPNMVDLINHADWLKMSETEISDRTRDIEPFVLAHPTVTNLDILAAPDNPAFANQMSEDDLTALMRAFAKFYQVIIVDTGTQITEWWNRAWLKHSSQTYLMVEPDETCLLTTADYARTARKLRALSLNACHVVCVRSDMTADGRSATDAVAAHFADIPAQRLFFLSDHRQDAASAGGFTSSRSAEYAEEVAVIVRAALDSYERDLSG